MLKFASNIDEDWPLEFQSNGLDQASAEMRISQLIEGLDNVDALGGVLDLLSNRTAPHFRPNSDLAVIHRKRLILVRETSDCPSEVDGLFQRRTSAVGCSLRAQGRQARQVDHFKLIGIEVGDIKRLAVEAESLFAWK
jgi:hypothetical protein